MGKDLVKVKHIKTDALCLSERTCNTAMKRCWHALLVVHRIFSVLRELTEYIHLVIFIYNTYRIHSALKMSPRKYLELQKV